jgi:hypothetical protein
MDPHKSAYEEFMRERKKAFEKLGEPVPEGPTYKEAMVMYIRNQASNTQAMLQEETQPVQNKEEILAKIARVERDIAELEEEERRERRTIMKNQKK